MPGRQACVPTLHVLTAQWLRAAICRSRLTLPKLYHSCLEYTMLFSSSPTGQITYSFPCVITELYLLFIFKIFFLCGPFLKSLLNLLQYCFCFLCFGFFGCVACGILAPRPGIKLSPPMLEGEVLTSRPPGKSLSLF